MNVETFGSPKLRLLEIIGALNNNRALLVDCGKPCTFFLWGLGDWGGLEPLQIFRCVYNN